MKKISLILSLGLIASLAYSETIIPSGWYEISTNSEEYNLPPLLDLQNIQTQDVDNFIFYDIESVQDENAPMLMSTFSITNIDNDLVKLAESLGNDEERIINFVNKKIKNEVYYGVRKGALMTFYDGAGNDYDKALLIYELLKAAGKHQDYYFAKTLHIYPQGDLGVGVKSIQEFLGLENSVSLSVNANRTYIMAILRSGNIPFVETYIMITGSQHIIVPVYVIPAIRIAKITYGSSSYMMTPPDTNVLGFEDSMNLEEFLNLSSSYLMNLTGGSYVTNGVSGLNESVLKNKLNEYSAKLAETLAENRDLGIDKVFGKGVLLSEKSTFDIHGILTRGMIPSTSIWGLNAFYGRSIEDIKNKYSSQFQQIANISNIPSLLTVFYKNIPEEDYSHFYVKYGTDSRTKRLQDLDGDRMWVYFDGNTGYLKYGDETWFSKDISSAASMDLNFYIKHAFDPLYGDADYIQDSDKAHESKESFRKGETFIYSLVYGFNNVEKILAKRNAIYIEKMKVAKSVANNFNDDGTFKITNNKLNATQRDLLAEGLNILGFSWLNQTSKSNQIIGNAYKCHTMSVHRFGKVAQENAFYIDVKLQMLRMTSSVGDYLLGRRAFDLATYFASAFEHGVIQQQQSANDAISTINIFHYANAKATPVPIVAITEANQIDSLIGYSTAEKNMLKAEFANSPAQSAYMIIPQNRNCVPNEWDWKGFGYIMSTSNSMGMMISSGQNGGYSIFDSYYNIGYSYTQSYTFPNYSYISPSISSFDNYYPTTWSSSSSSYSSISVTNYSYIPTFSMPTFMASDPVNMFNGAYEYDIEDISFSDTLQFSRSYNSKMNEIESGLGYGWDYNYNINVTIRSAYEASLGETTAEQAARIAVAVHSAKLVYEHSSASISESVKSFLITAFIAKYAVDSIFENAVSVKIGKESMQFVKQFKNIGTEQNPNIVEYFAPPAGTNFSLVKNSAGRYELSEPYGATMIFNAKNDIEKVKDIFGRETLFTYNSAGNLTKVKDPKNNELNLTWQDGFLKSISCGGKTVSYTYQNKALTKVTDVLGNDWKYEYDSEQRLTTLKNPTENGDIVIIENIYSDTGEVIEQLNCGDSAKRWNLSYVGYESQTIDPLGNIQKFEYDRRGVAVKSTNELGNATVSEYDAQIRLVKSTMPNGDELRIAYNNWHSKISEDIYEKVDNAYVWKSGTLYTYENATQANGSVPRLLSMIKRDAENSSTGRVSTINAYKALTNGTKTNLPTSVIDERGITTLYTYDNLGRLLTESTAGRTTTYSNYNNFDKPEIVVSPDGLVQTVTYNSSGYVASTTLAGLTTEYIYDAKGQVTETRQTGSGLTNALVEKVFYDPVGNIVKTINNEGIQTTSTWNSMRKKLSETVGTGANAQTTTYVYDLADRLVKIIAPDGKEIVSTLDAVGQTTSTTFAGRTSSTEFDNLGRAVKTTSPQGIEVSFTYDALGKTSMTDGEGKTVNYTYNVFGEQTSLKNRRNGIFLMNTDIPNKKSSVTTPMGKVSTVEYSPTTWDVVEAIPASGDANKTTFAYNQAGQLTSTNDPVGSITYAYDSNSRLQSMTENGNVISYTYDVLGRVVSSTAEDKIVSYTYTPSGKINSITYPQQNGISPKTVNYFYDTLGRLSLVKDWASRETFYTYDNGNRLTRIDRPNGSYRTLEYDSLTGELLKIEERTATNIPILLHKFEYDNDSRIVKNFRVPLEMKFDRNVVTSAFNLDNQLTSFEWGGEMPMSATPQYDDNGNMTFGPIAEKKAVYFNYDARNRLTYAGGVTYSYDSENNRKTVTYTKDSSTITNSYVYDRSGKLPNVLIRNKTVSIGAQNPNSETHSTYYIHGVGLGYEVSFDSAGNEIDIKFYHYDQVGSTIALTDDAGTITDKFSYDTWGYSAHTTGTTDTPFLYVGLYGIQTDSSGLINMRARYYNPTTQSFISSDPTGFGGGLNWYLYANGDTLSYIDFTGNYSFKIAILGGLRVLGGALEMLAGSVVIGLGGGASATGIGTVPGVGAMVVGGIAFVHGADTAAAGLSQIWTGSYVDSYTSQAIQSVGVSRQTANTADAAAGMLLSVGSTSLANSYQVGGSLTHYTSTVNAEKIVADGILKGSNYATGYSFAAGSIGSKIVTGGVASQTSLTLTGSAANMFNPVVQVGLWTSVQALSRNYYTANGALNLVTGVFSRMGINGVQSTIYTLDSALTGAYLGATWHFGGNCP